MSPMELSNRSHGRRAVVALGGNAITRPGEEGTVDQDYRNLDRSLEGILTLLERGYQLLITHGNGPQVGNQMLRVELARGQAPILPLDVIGADLQGGLGYMIERVMRHKLRQRGMLHRVCCMLSMIEVDAADPAFENPTKYVGTFYDEDQLAQLAREHPSLGGAPGRQPRLAPGRAVAKTDQHRAASRDPDAAGCGHGGDQRRRWWDPGGAVRDR